MTLEELYNTTGGNYRDTVNRFGDAEMVKRFVRKFVTDKSFEQLKDSLFAGETEKAFRSCHTLKGVCLNLGFDRLYESSAALTEHLRGRDCSGYEALFEELTVRYEALMAALKELEAQG